MKNVDMFLKHILQVVAVLLLIQMFAWLTLSIASSLYVNITWSGWSFLSTLHEIIICAVFPKWFCLFFLCNTCKCLASVTDLYLLVSATTRTKVPQGQEF